ncbi:hypothetical protein C884_00739 [Kocuria palustris PEL]|uniref:Uncharacterized protein n=1 Tax=Kocuria palustris PEL TaxID=1236550 RepID=M2YCL4_9MICC|nr:hypothetical protein C884_00739 [Kocuria palustris PEL]
MLLPVVLPRPLVPVVGDPALDLVPAVRPESTSGGVLAGLRTVRVEPLSRGWSVRVQLPTGGRTTSHLWLLVGHLRRHGRP